MWRYLGTIRVSDTRQSNGAKKDGVCCSGCFFPTGLDVDACTFEVAGTRFNVLILEFKTTRTTPRRFNHTQRGVGDVDTDSITPDYTATSSTSLRIGGFLKVQVGRS